MEFGGVQRGKSRRKRRHVKRRRREHHRSEVKSKRLKLERGNVAREKLIPDSMQADSFWKNYTVAQEWQKRHSVTWWKTRCFALEYENQILREKLRSLASQGNRAVSSVQARKERCGQRPTGKEEEEEEEEATEGEEEPDAESLEFHVNEDMKAFLEQSMRHKIELRKKKESESMAAKEGSSEETLEGGLGWIRARNDSAKLLYGDASPTILAMETALQATIDRHKDRAKPQYWPVIPLRP